MSGISDAVQASVVIPSWNTKQLLMECIQTIRETANPKSFEIVVVDNASVDGSCEAVSAKWEDVIVIMNAANVGFAKACNIGLRQSKGRYICLVNSDVKLRAGCMQALIRHLDMHPDVGLAGPRILNPDSTAQDSCRRSPSVWDSLVEVTGLHNRFGGLSFLSGGNVRPGKACGSVDVDILSGCFWMIRREAMCKVGLLDEGFYFYGEDKDYCLRLARAGWRISYVPSATAVHLVGASSSRDTRRFVIELQKASLRLWRLHYGTTKRALLVLTRVLYLSTRITSLSVRVTFWTRTHAGDRNRMVALKAALRWILTETFVMGGAFSGGPR